MKLINLSVPNLKGNENKYLKQCIDTEWVSSVGSFVNKFEKEISKFTNTKYSIACNSGTSALHLALISSGVKANDEVIVPTMTFIATPNSVKYINAIPIFMDCDNYLNIDIEKLKKFFATETVYRNGNTYNKQTKRKISAIIPVHVSGNAVDIEAIIKLCKKKNIKIIEDIAEALGTRYTIGKFKNKHVGSQSTLGCLSFNGNKIITSGGGGMVITNNKKIAKAVRYLSTQANNNSQEYIHNEIGYNYRLTNIQAAVGLAQLEKIENFVRKKNQIYKFYLKAFKENKNISVLRSPNYSSNNHWMISIFIKNIKNKRHRSDLIKQLKNKGIETRPMWHLCHLQKPYLQNQSYMISNAQKLQKKILNIPSSTGISINELNKVSSIINKMIL